MMTNAARDLTTETSTRTEAKCVFEAEIEILEAGLIHHSRRSASSGSFALTKFLLVKTALKQRLPVKEVRRLRQNSAH